MPAIFHHNGKTLKTEEEYFCSVCENGEVRNAVSLSAARFYKKLYETLLLSLSENFREGIKKELNERIKS